MAVEAVNANSPDRKRLVGQRLGRYDILHLLAAGGMGSVYVARHAGMAGFERLVAIKTLHSHLADEEQFVNMFLDEARLAAGIRHPNVVSTLDISESPQDGYFLVMEYVEGENLAAILKNCVLSKTMMPVTIVLRIVIDALNGLAAAHNLATRDGKSLNLVHRDISPQNVLVGTDGISRLTDFGIAKAEINISTTRHGQLKGKLSYMAPEQATHGRVEQRSDLFSMGVVLWESLTQRRLFRGRTNAETLHKVLLSVPPPPSSVRPELAIFDGLLRKALSKPLNERFQTAQEMAETIERLAPEVGGIAPGRAVALFLQRLANEKLAQENAAIDAAIKELSASAGIAVPVNVDVSSQEEVTPVTEYPPEMDDDPKESQSLSLSYSLPNISIPKRTKVIAAAVAAALLMIGVVIGLATRSSKDETARTDESLPATSAEPAAPDETSTEARDPSEEARGAPEQPDSVAGKEHKPVEAKPASVDPPKKVDRPIKASPPPRRPAHRPAPSKKPQASPKDEVLDNPYR